MEPIRLLVVDDNAEFRSIALQVIESHPNLAVVGQAADGEAAVMQASRLRPDVVLMDVAMPILGGLEATRKIGRDSPDVRVILLLSTCSEEYRRAARECGAAASVAKERLDEELLPAIVAATAH
jgi:DNA-binding NarL/FixJ family response regulator